MAAARKTSLRAVKPDEKPPTKRPKIESVLDAAEHGTRLDELIQMRRVAARRLDDPNTPAPALAAIMRQHRELAEEIESLKRMKSEEAEQVGVSDDEEWSEEAI